MVMFLGADTLLDYTRSDFKQSLQCYDVIFDAVGKMNSLLAKKYLTRTGDYLNVLTSSYGLKLKSEDLVFLKEPIN